MIGIGMPSSQRSMGIFRFLRSGLHSANKTRCPWLNRLNCQYGLN